MLWLLILCNILDNLSTSTTAHSNYASLAGRHLLNQRIACIGLWHFRDAERAQIVRPVHAIGRWPRCGARCIFPSISHDVEQQVSCPFCVTHNSFVNLICSTFLNVGREIQSKMKNISTRVIYNNTCVSCWAIRVAICCVSHGGKFKFSIAFECMQNCYSKFKFCCLQNG